MIISSQYKLEAGKVYGPESFPNVSLHYKRVRHEEFRFMVMRESTYEEYKKYYEEEFGKWKNEPPFDNFYLISSD